MYSFKYLHKHRLTPHVDPVIRTIVVTHVTLEYVGGIPNTAIGAIIILPRAALPCGVFRDVCLVTGVRESNTTARYDRHRVFEVGDSGEPSDRRVDIVSECWVTNLRKVSFELDVLN